MRGFFLSNTVPVSSSGVRQIGVGRCECGYCLHVVMYYSFLTFLLCAATATICLNFSLLEIAEWESRACYFDLLMTRIQRVI